MCDWHSLPGWREKGVFGFNEDEEDEEEEAGGWSWWWEQMMIWHHGPIWPEKDEFASFSFTLPLAQHSIAQLGLLWKLGKAFLTHHFFAQTGQSLAEKNALWIIDKEISERGGVPLLQSQFHKVFVDSETKVRQRVPFAKIRPKWKVVWWDQGTTQFKGQRH